jgi:hypothetical protein
MKKLVIIFIIIGALSSCEKDSFPKKDDGIVRGLGGSCGWLIEIAIDNDSGKRTFLESTNIDDFGLDLHEGMSVEFKYNERNDLSSNCMMGRIVEFTKLKENK